MQGEKKILFQIIMIVIKGKRFFSAFFWNGEKREGERGSEREVVFYLRQNKEEKNTD